MKNNKMIDLGILGKWSETTLKENIEINKDTKCIYIKPNHPLSLSIYSLKPKEPKRKFSNLLTTKKSFFNKYSLIFEKYCYFDTEVEVGRFIDAGIVDTIIKDNIKYELKLIRWEEQLEKTQKILEEIFCKEK